LHTKKHEKNLLKLHDDGKFGAHKKKNQNNYDSCDYMTGCCVSSLLKNNTFCEEIWQKGLHTNIAVCVCSVTGGDGLTIEYYKA
jgi:hypothetical protein